MTFAYHKPTSLPEALALLTAKSNQCPVLAGGTDLLVQWRTGAISPAGFIDISGLEELRAITFTKTHIEIGALTTYSRIVDDEKLTQVLPALVSACQSVGGMQIQNMGTIGGNIMSASPAADMPPVLMAYDSRFLAQSLKGDRWISADQSFTAYRKTALRPDELLTKIRINLPDPFELTRFYKIGARRAQAISKVSMCARGAISHGGIEWIRIALGSVAPIVIRAHGTEALLKGKVITEALMDDARRSLSDEIHPISDIRSTSYYRSFASAGLLVRYLRDVTTYP